MRIKVIKTITNNELRMMKMSKNNYGLRIKAF